jgi:plasmid stabilization system protein ParE
MNLRWSPLARDRLLAIQAHIGADSPAAAERLVERLVERATLLTRFPGMGRAVPELPRAGLRELIEGKYRIVYRERRDVIEIVTVFEGHLLMESALERRETLEHGRLDGARIVVLFRPIGELELELVRASGMRRWPPRLDDQPIFYPVTNERYAREIAEGWNARDGARGFVTRFHVRAELALRYPIQIVGAGHHAELWVPADDLDAFNDGIVGLIEVVATFD